MACAPPKTYQQVLITAEELRRNPQQWEMYRSLTSHHPSTQTENIDFYDVTGATFPGVGRLGPYQRITCTGSHTQYHNNTHNINVYKHAQGHTQYHNITLNINIKHAQVHTTTLTIITDQHCTDLFLNFPYSGQRWTKSTTGYFLNYIHCQQTYSVFLIFRKCIS